MKRIIDYKDYGVVLYISSPLYSPKYMEFYNGVAHRYPFYTSFEMVRPK